MKKNNVSNPISTFAAFSVITIVFASVKRMIKKYHKKQEIFF